MAYPRDRNIKTYIKTLEKVLRSNDESVMELSLSRFLLQNRITFTSTTNKSPSELLMSQNIKVKSRLDLIFP